MSWLTEFTSKAENLLTKFDQSAAQTFNESSSGLPDTTKINAPVYNTTTHVTSSPSNYQTASPRFEASVKPGPTASISSDTTHVTTFTSPEQPKSIPRTSSTVKKKDDQLFEFLNSNNPSTAIKGHTRNLSGPKTFTPITSTPRKTLSHDNLSPLSKSSVATDIPTTDIPTTDIQQGAKESKIETSFDKKAVSKDVQSNSDVVDGPPPKEQVSHGGGVSGMIKKSSDDRISNLELENRLLKNELHSLNEELASTTTRLNEQSQETEKYRLRYENRRSQQNEDYERIRMDYENRITDLGEALKAKDSQLAVLRVRIQEADGELKEKTGQLQGIHTQNEQILKDHSEASDVHGTVIKNLRDKLQETESSLQKEKLENLSIKNELTDLQTKVHEEQHQYAENMKDLQSKQSQGKDKFRDLESKLKIAEDTSTNAQKELKDYKDKAARILQAKERLIASLRQGSDTSDIPPTLLSELEEMKQDRDMLREEVQQYSYKNEQLRSEFLDLELLQKTESDDNQDKIDALQSSLEEELEKRKTAEEDMKRYIQELHFSREELHNAKKSHMERNEEYESTIKRLQNQINVKQSMSTSQEELENRIRTLTDSLIHKQTVVEALSTEKNSLVLQLERLEKQYRDVQNSLLKRTKSSNHHDVEDPEGGSSGSSMTSIMPDQINRNVRWRTTVNEIDRFSIRLGVFLRRYPIARLMVIFYMLLLHLWVTFVLLTYTPEMHHDPPHQ